MEQTSPLDGRNRKALLPGHEGKFFILSQKEYGGTGQTSLEPFEAKARPAQSQAAAMFPLPNCMFCLDHD